MTYIEYPKDGNKYDMANAVINEVEGVDYLSIPIEGDGNKLVSLDDIEAAKELCLEVEGYTENSRFLFWEAAETKFNELT